MAASKRSRKGCHQCKQSRVKCDEAKPKCSSCVKLNKACDYSLKLTWGGRPYKVPKVEKMNPLAAASSYHLKGTKNKSIPKPKLSSSIQFKIETPNSATVKRELIEKPASQQALRKSAAMHSPVSLDSTKTLAFIDDLINNASQHWQQLHENSPNPSNITCLDSIEDDNEDNFTLDLDQINSLTPNNCANNNGLLPSTPFIDYPSPIKISPTSSEEVEQIPRGLVPLPDILLNVPFYYESFLFYMNSTTSILTPADNAIYIDNPFKIVLPKLAMANEGLMSLLIAFGIGHKSALENDTTKEGIIDSLVNRALKELFTLLNDEETATSDLTLSLVMMLSSFAVFSLRTDEPWRLHMKGAKQIFFNRGYHQPFNKLLNDAPTASNSMKSKVLYFLIRWFAYIDVFTNLSSPLDPTLLEIDEARLNGISLDFSLDSGDQNQMDYNFNDASDTLVKIESNENVDNMLGINLKMIPVLSKLCTLIKNVNLTDALGLPSSPSITESALNIQQLLNQFKTNIFVDTQVMNHKHINQLIAANQCFLSMGLLQLYRRVLKIPRESNLVQSLCNQMKFLIENYIDTTSPNSITLILPLFVAGCESLDELTRTFYLTRLIDLKIRGAINADCAMNIMESCWTNSQNWWEIMLLANKKVVFI